MAARSARSCLKNDENTSGSGDNADKDAEAARDDGDGDGTGGDVSRDGEEADEHTGREPVCFIKT